MDEQLREMNEKHLKMIRGMQTKIVQNLMTLDPSTLSPMQLVRWFDITTKYERQILGVKEQKTVVHEHTGFDGGPIEHVISGNREPSVVAATRAAEAAFYEQITGESLSLGDAERPDSDPDYGEDSLQALGLSGETLDGSESEEDYPEGPPDGSIELRRD
jgi:hypothetical protein